MHYTPVGAESKPAVSSAREESLLDANPIPVRPKNVPEYHLDPLSAENHIARSVGALSLSGESASWQSDRSSISDAPSTPKTEPQIDEIIEEVAELPVAAVTFHGVSQGGRRRASTTLISQNGDEIRKLLGDAQAGTRLIERFCCGGGCCKLDQIPPPTPGKEFVPVLLPDNDAFRGLQLRLGPLSLKTNLTNLPALPEPTASFAPVDREATKNYISNVQTHPPSFVQPHPPYAVFSAPVFHARELTNPGAEKRTFHFDLDVTDYPDEGGVDFKVGGAIGICPPNAPELVNDILDVLGVPKNIRDKAVTLRTTGGRWPTIWGEEEARELLTTRRELLTWCTDLQSTPPTKALLRVLAEYADAENERQILMYLASAQGQATFCDLRTGPHVTVNQLLHAFPSSKPPLPALFSVLKQLMPRFYSLSNDPHVSSAREGLAGRHLIEMAVTIHETPDWRGGTRTGVGSGFMERQAHHFMASHAPGLALSCSAADSDNPISPPAIHIPMFRGLMANPLSREFVSDGPMLLIGAGVGMAPFRGFILNRLKNANCANKIWLVQGVRDSNLDELYSGELGDHESSIKKVVQSRRRTAGVENEAKYVQDEVRHSADIVWHVVNAVDGRVFVCGSTKGMGEGVHEALLDVVMKKGNLNREQAEEFWTTKKTDGQYIAETW